ncbi:hypothetical protein ACFO1V_07645 [Daeguia caeni]|uniref:Lipoprotein n=1 Tax=Daeguia caeni TaxID=439612 RepID=A0ABV9H3W3_9HYPH
MQKASKNHSPLYSVFAAALLVALAGCNTAGTGRPTVASNGEARIKESELRAYCPQATLREGTAFFNTYEKGGEQDPNRVVYQAAITDITRACKYGDGMMNIEVAVAGKVVPGPKYRNGTITMPIRVAVLDGDRVVYSQLHKQMVNISNGDVATQFVMNDKGISIPIPEKQTIQIFVGFDEGPVKAQK